MGNPSLVRRDVDPASDIVVGSIGQVTSGIADFSSLQGAINAASAGQKILILNGTYIENITLDKKIVIEGQGHSTFINGTFTLTSSSNFSLIKKIRIGGNLSLNVGADGNFINECWVTSSVVITDSGSGNSLTIIQE